MLEKRRLIVSNSRCRGHHLTYSMNFPTITERNQTCTIEARASRLQSHSPLYHPGSLQHTLSWDLTISKATVLKIHEKPVIVHDWWLPDTCGLLSRRGELEVVFGKTRQLCMYVATWCEYGSFSLQYTGQSPSIIQTATLGSQECWVGEGPLAGVRREWSQLRCLHQSLLHLVMAHLSELNKQLRPHKLQVCPHAFVSAFVRNRKAVRSWSEVGETVKVLHLYRSKLTGNYKSALILLPSVIMLVCLE